MAKTILEISKFCFKIRLLTLDIQLFKKILEIRNFLQDSTLQNEDSTLGFKESTLQSLDSTLEIRSGVKGLFLSFFPISSPYSLENTANPSPRNHQIRALNTQIHSNSCRLILTHTFFGPFTEKIARKTAKW